VPEALRNADALVAVLGLYHLEDAAKLGPELKKALADVEAEILVGDQALLESRLEKVRKAARVGKKAESPREPELLERCVEALNSETPLRGTDFDAEEERLLKGYQLLTRKPLLAVLNISESLLAEGEKLARDLMLGPRTAGISLCARVEAEIVSLPPEERPAFLEVLGLKEPARDRLIRASYELLGLQSFFTVGKDEVRAWTVSMGATAVEAAGAIHTDLARGFIRAEVISYEQMVEAGTLAKARDRGWLRLEGKEYIVRDGDILNVRFSV
jgi:GTP-binding protein YchF